MGQKKKQLKNVNDMRDRLEILYLNLETGMTKAVDGKEMANVAGKMLSSAKLQLEYCSLRKERPNIAFLDGD